eukprot:322847_1
MGNSNCCGGTVSQSKKETLLKHKVNTYKKSNERKNKLIMGDTVKNVESVAQRQKDILNELQQMNTILNKLENKMKIRNTCIDNDNNKQQQPFDDIMGDTVKNVDIMAKKQNNILKELQQLTFALDTLEHKSKRIYENQIVSV